jgi:hypothetical protein
MKTDADAMQRARLSFSISAHKPSLNPLAVGTAA